MNNWQEVKLGKVCIQITDGVHNSVKDDKNGEFYLLSCKNIKNGNVSIGTKERKISKETFFIALSESDKITYLEDDVVDNLIDNEKKELNSLTEDEMLIYKYYVLHKLSQSEIAKLMNTSQSTISRKIKNLKKKYKK